MTVKRSNDGLKRCNTRIKKVEPIINVKKLKDVYLFGINIEDNNGTTLPDSTYQQYIDNAVSMLEHDLDISIAPEIGHVEYKDYYFNDYKDWGYLLLNNFPVINIQKMELVYFRDNDGNDESVQEIPHSWIKLQNHDGMIRLVPNSQFAARLQVGATGSFFPEILRADTVPHAWKITYDHGFEDGRVPVVINHAIGLLAAIQALITGGNLVIGAGIAATEISIDGLSQSIQTTQSAENSAYSATIKEYQALLVGKNEADYKNSIMKKLRDYYKGETMTIL